MSWNNIVQFKVYDWRLWQSFELFTRMKLNEIILLIYEFYLLFVEIQFSLL
jgi:hypothetical protein